MPKVSIIVPIYNVEKYLQRCMDSLLQQSLKDIEIILVDDESPDNCPALCDEYAQQDSRVKVIHKKNGGLGLARNSGLQIATGEYVAFIDSDDYVDILMFETLHQKAEEHRLDAVFCGFYVQRGEEKSPVQEVDEVKMYHGADEVRKVLFDMIGSEPAYYKDNKLSMSVWHGIYSRALIAKYNLNFCSERVFISEDIIFHIDYLSKADNIAFLPDCLMYHIKDNYTSLTNSYRDDRFEKAKVLYQGVVDRLDAVGLMSKEAKDRAKRLFIGYSRTVLFQICKSNKAGLNKNEKLKEVATDQIWRQVLNDYAYDQLPLKHRLIIYCIKYRLTFLIRMIASLK